MSKEITLQTLIEKVKADLFSPYTDSSQIGKSAYPVFFVDQVELELTVEFTYDAEAGLKVTIPQIVEGSITGGQGKVTGHKMKITLSPILPHDELRTELQQDSKTYQGIREASRLAITKGVELPGPKD